MKTFREFVFITSSRRYEALLRINPKGWNLTPQNTLLGMGSQGGIWLQLRPGREGRCVLNCFFLVSVTLTLPFQILAIALAMLEVLTPTFRAISASDKPNSSTPRFAIPARTALTFLRRFPSMSSFTPIPPLLHSSSIIVFSPTSFENGTDKVLTA